MLLEGHSISCFFVLLLLLGFFASSVACKCNYQVKISFFHTLDYYHMPAQLLTFPHLYFVFSAN